VWLIGEGWAILHLKLYHYFDIAKNTETGTTHAAVAVPQAKSLPKMVAFCGRQRSAPLESSGIAHVSDSAGGMDAE
jgi:hypothetical protein